MLEIGQSLEFLDDLFDQAVREFAVDVDLVMEIPPVFARFGQRLHQQPDVRMELAEHIPDDLPDALAGQAELLAKPFQGRLAAFPPLQPPQMHNPQIAVLAQLLIRELVRPGGLNLADGVSDPLVDGHRAPFPFLLAADPPVLQMALQPVHEFDDGLLADASQFQQFRQVRGQIADLVPDLRMELPDQRLRGGKQPFLQPEFHIAGFKRDHAVLPDDHPGFAGGLIGDRSPVCVAFRTVDRSALAELTLSVPLTTDAWET